MSTPRRKLPSFKLKTPVPPPLVEPITEPKNEAPAPPAPESPIVDVPLPPKSAKKTLKKSLKLAKPFIPAIGKPTSDIWNDADVTPAFADDPATHVEEMPDTFYPINRFGFASATTQAYENYTLPPPAAPNPERCADIASSTKEVKRFMYQRFVRDYMQSRSPYRGMLVYHGLGSGKTCTAVGTAEAMRTTEPHRHVFVMTPASLRTNFRNDLKKCGSTAYSTAHNWLWLDVNPSVDAIETDPAFRFLVDTIGIPEKSVKSHRGGWYYNPLPDAEPNFEELTAEQQTEINKQIEDIIDSRYTFISYNGLQRKSINRELCETGILPSKEPGKPAKKVWRNKFDGALVVIDEIHNFVRKITSIIEQVFNEEDVRVRDDSLLPACRGEGAFAGLGYPIGYVLYHWLTTARDCRILGLSGTPIINFANEVAILMNMLHGNTEIARFPVKLDGKPQRVLENHLKKHPLVDYLAVKLSGTEAGVALVETTRCPDRNLMKRDEKGELIGLIPDKESEKGYKNPPIPIGLFASILRKYVERAGYEIPALRTTFKTTEAYELLPVGREDFYERYVSPDFTGLLRTEQLKRRLSGLVSFYRGTDFDLMPRAIGPTLVVLPLSEYQASMYAAVRMAEMEKERALATRRQAKTQKKKKGTSAKEMDLPSSYKIYSRAACNFVFPEELDRPRPGEDQIGLELDIASENVPEEEEPPVIPKSATDYFGRVQAAFAEIWDRRDEVLTLKDGNDEGLRKYSAKYAEILTKLGDLNGSALVYSQFKSIEGLKLLSMAMDANGYAPMRLKHEDGVWSINYASDADKAKPKYILYSGDIDEKEREMLRKVFNGQWGGIPDTLRQAVEADAAAQDVTNIKEGVNPNMRGEIVKVFMITEAGAEGISLKNVRQVHMLEPYWNMVRLEQVQGRAARLCSHMELPEDERTIEVFIYLMTFTKEQLSKYATLTTNDNKQTTDQNVYDIAQRKLVIANALSKALQEAAVDCALFTNQNNVACSIRAGADDKFLYTPILKEDDAIDDTNILKVRAVLDKKRGLVLDKATGKVIGRIVDGKPVLDAADASKAAPVTTSKAAHVTTPDKVPEKKAAEEAAEEAEEEAEEETEEEAEEGTPMVITRRKKVPVEEPMVITRRKKAPVEEPMVITRRKGVKMATTTTN